ncbi:hypothetical protein FRACYDRAFT_249834 [Fragilariopsis cylindrus CCMP1102]|uniref:Uncharacterized protein n=1 Tax=Fragilariopsis cylindrus CCMP1102 TaxID=635003 RepID=A0A1E7ER32_9STRA|nr:hypothetical protein FRACYDRAFT_249834 [Fragilariopsis cylindrus CCMP1102]|eukprot:OEU08480.1 hypothetical protein FRACYDRAFT_249834 [Fragilariopsis cylindrus CCMP1102]
MGFSSSSLSSLSLPTSPLNTFHNKRQVSISISILPSSSSLTKLGARDDDEEDDREFARVRRSRGRRAYNDDDDDDNYERDTYRDSTADRFGELASDPWFWWDMFLFISFLNFISFIGPRNPFPEIIPAMYTAGLPPPGL